VKINLGSNWQKKLLPMSYYDLFVKNKSLSWIEVNVEQNKLK
jgi:hypothetical protein